jgi:hypothetical protein
MEDLLSQAWFFVLAGFVGGLAMFARGLVAYRRDRLVSSVATSSIEAIAAGEVRITGEVVIDGSVLVSPIQSKPCVWYRSKIDDTSENGGVILNEERAQHFFIDDGTSRIRVVPRGARWEVGLDYDESTSFMGDEPVGLERRTGAAHTTILPDDPEAMSGSQRQVAIASLLTVRPAAEPAVAEGFGSSSAGLATGFGLGATSGGRRYREARLEPGDAVTIIGQALVWGDVKSAMHAWDPSTNVESTIADDLAAARAAGILANSPEEAWGNAAIPGFGIGMPAEAPELHPDAHEAEVADAETAAEYERRHEIPDEDLVITRGDRGDMAIYDGTPAAATTHHDFAFAMGVMGALMAVFCALGIGAILSGNL